MDLVLDASLAVKLLFDEQYSDATDALVSEARRLGGRIYAPPHMRPGLTNIIRRRMRVLRMPLATALSDLDRMLNLPIMIVDLPSLYPAALRLADAFSLSTYDALYVALAQALDCDLWTDDQRVLRAVAGGAPFVRWIGDYAALGR